MSRNHQLYTNKNNNFEYESFRAKYPRLFNEELMTYSLAEYIDNLDNLILTKFKYFYRNYYESVIQAYRDFKFLFAKYTLQKSDKEAFQHAYSKHYLYSFYIPSAPEDYNTRKANEVYDLIIRQELHNEEVILIRLIIEEESNILHFLKINTYKKYSHSAIDIKFIAIDSVKDLLQ